MRFNFLPSALLLFFLPLAGWSQLALYPLEKSKLPQTTTAAKVSAPTLPPPPLSLPFWDDFSYTTTPYPLDSLWEKGADVFINDGQGINPPTINVATFDGLTANGTPYSPSPSDFLDFGYRDTLQSRSINMTEVALADRNHVFLSFYYQWKGNGEPPDANDFLRLEFKNSSDTWNEITTLRTEENTNETAFNTYTFRVNQDEYYHDTFQFRFISYGRKSGRYDMWNLDYVYLNIRSTKEENNTSISDRAMTTTFTSALGDYYAVPYAHFKSHFLTNFIKPTFEVYNLKDTSFSQVIKYSTYFTIANYQNSTETVSFDDFVEINQNIVIPSLGREQYELLSLPDTLYFDPQADSASVFLKIGLESGDMQQDYYDRYEPINFFLNDTLTHTFKLKDYYAYDDGVSEYAAGLTQPGNQFAYQFDLQTTAVDTLIGLSVHFPIFAGPAPNTVNFFVLEADENGLPGKELYDRIITVNRKPNDEFVHADFPLGVLVQGRFFIGYSEPIDGRVRIGLDKSHDTGDRMFYRTSSSIEDWSVNDRVTGNLMIRPHFGHADALVVGLPEVEAVPDISVYPNPNKGEFYLKGNVSVLGIASITGQSVAFTAEDEGELKRITLPGCTPGFYFVKYTNGTSFKTAKIRIQP